MRSHWGHGRFVAIPMVFLMLMMIKLIFSQAVMEIYAYNYISQCKVEKSVREDRIQLKSKQDNDKTASEKEKTEKNRQKKTKRMQAMPMMKPAMYRGVLHWHFPF